MSVRKLGVPRKAENILAALRLVARFRFVKAVLLNIQAFWEITSSRLHGSNEPSAFIFRVQQSQNGLARFVEGRYSS
jgi:hypothetical protein